MNNQGFTGNSSFGRVSNRIAFRWENGRGIQAWKPIRTKFSSVKGEMSLGLTGLCSSFEPYLASVEGDHVTMSITIKI